MRLAKILTIAAIGACIAGNAPAQEEEKKKLVMPKTELQQKLYDIVSGILGHQDFGTDTDFYRAGLDSMGSVLLLTELSDRLNFLSIFWDVSLPW